MIGQGEAGAEGQCQHQGFVAPKMNVILQTIGSLLAAAIGGAIGWVTLEFVARPIRKFYDLRGEIIQRMAQYANVRVPLSPSIGNEDTLTLSEAEIAKLDEARNVMRDLASRMRSFSLNEPTAGRILSFLRYDASKASDGLFGVSNTMDTYGANKAWAKKTVADALRIPENIL